MFEFRTAEHLQKPGTKIIELWNEGEFMATVYPTENGIKVVSKHFPFMPQKTQKIRQTIVDIDCNQFPTSVLINVLQEPE